MPAEPEPSAETLKPAPGQAGAAAPPEVAAAPPSAHFGKFVRTKHLGAGGMGEVWKAWDSSLSRWVALKFVKGSDPDELARFAREAQTAAQLAHPNIAAIYEVGDSGGRPFIAMQFIDGQTLRAYPRNDVRRLVGFVRDAARAVHVAHEKNIVHRDLKPENLMVDASGRLFVMDFGLARQAAVKTSLSVSGMAIGTPAYMPPEQARGQVRATDARSDVYSLGATLYEMLADRPPLQASDVVELLVKVVSEDPKPVRVRNPRVDRDLETIVMTCLEKDPARRYRSASALADDLDRWLAGEPIAARPASAFDRTLRRIRRNKALTAALAGIVLVLVAAGVALIIQKSDTDKLRHLSGIWMQVIEKKRDLRTLRVPADKARAALEDAVRRLDEFVVANPDLAQGWYIRARAHVYLGDVDRAESDARTCVRLAPDFGAAWALLALVLLEQVQLLDFGDDENRGARKAAQQRLITEACEALRRGTAAHATGDAVRRGVPPTSEDEIASRLTSALQKFYILHEEDAARRELEEAGRDVRAEEYALWRMLWCRNDIQRRQAAEDLLRWAPGYAFGRYARGVTLHVKKALAEAVAEYDEALRLKPDLARALNNRGEARRVMGDIDGAIRDLDELVRLRPRDGNAFYNRGLARQDRGDVDGALRDYDEAIRLDGTQHQACRNRGLIRHQRGDFVGALRDFDEALRIKPDKASAFLSRGLTRRAMGDLEGAIHDYGECIRIRPEEANAHYNRGNAWSQKGDAAAAIRDYDEAIRLNGDYVEALMNRGLLRQRQRQFDAALRDFNDVLRIRPQLPEALNSRGSVRLVKGDVAGAFQDLEEAIRIRPDFYDAIYNRGVCRWVKRDWDAATVDVEHALRLAPADWPNRDVAQQTLKDIRARRAPK